MQDASVRLELMRCAFVQQQVQICGRPNAGVVGVLLRIASCVSWNSVIGERIAAANDGRIKLDTLPHLIPKRNMYKHILVSLGTIVAIALFVACQQQPSTTTTTAAPSTVARSRNQTVSASTNRDIPPGGMRRPPTPTPTP